MLFPAPLVRSCTKQVVGILFAFVSSIFIYKVASLSCTTNLLICIFNPLEISIASNQWEEENIEEYRLKQEVKKYQLALIRLAGKKTVENLNIAQFDLTFQNIKRDDLNFEKKNVNINDFNIENKEEGKNK